MISIRKPFVPMKRSRKDERLLPSRNLLLLVLTTLFAASLACNLPGLRRSPDDQLEPLPVTTEAAGQLEENIEEAADALSNGNPFTLTIDETQLTSAANLKLGSMQEARVNNLQIYLRDGQIKIFGDVIRDGVTLPASVAARVYAAQGSVAYEILDARIGPFSLPQGIVDDLEAQLDQFILAQLSPDTSSILIEEISIADGVMTITGHAR